MRTSLVGTLTRLTNTCNRFAIQENYPTGHCVALVRGAERTLLAHPGAADRFGLSDLESSGILRTLRASKERVVVYVEGFFAIHSWDVTVRLAEVSYKLTNWIMRISLYYDEDT